MRPHKSPHHDQMQEQTFMEDLQDSLLDNNNDPYGIDAFQTIYNKKKIINQRIEKEKKKKKQVHEALVRAKQRIAQVEQLNEKVEKQSSLLKNQITKISEVHMMSKILMMEKILKLQRQTEDMEKKRKKNYEIRAERQRGSLTQRVSAITKIEKNRALSLSKTIELNQERDLNEYNSWKARRSKVQELKIEKQRRKRKSQRIQEYKRMIAEKNYQQKIQAVQKNLKTKQAELENLCSKQTDEERRLRATNHITKQYLDGFFATETI